jgi:hypothetical protein
MIARCRGHIQSRTQNLTEVSLSFLLDHTLLPCVTKDEGLRIPSCSPWRFQTLPFCSTCVWITLHLGISWCVCFTDLTIGKFPSDSKSNFGAKTLLYLNFVFSLDSWRNITVLKFGSSAAIGFELSNLQVFIIWYNLYRPRLFRTRYLRNGLKYRNSESSLF